jgi:hypothetical protein
MWIGRRTEANETTSTEDHKIRGKIIGRIRYLEARRVYERLGKKLDWKIRRNGI